MCYMWHLASNKLNMAGGGKVRRMMVNNLLSILTIAGVIVGVICGYLIRISKDEEPKHTDELIKAIRFVVTYHTRIF